MRAVAAPDGAGCTGSYDRLYRAVHAGPRWRFNHGNPLAACDLLMPLEGRRVPH